MPFRQKKAAAPLFGRRGVVLIASGLVLGMRASLVLTRILKSVLYGVKPIDARALVVAAVPLAGVGMAACYVPARKAGAVGPMR
jgi:hypothetical protein